jgi:hypothetical protein
MSRLLAGRSRRVGSDPPPPRLAPPLLLARGEGRAKGGMGGGTAAPAGGKEAAPSAGGGRGREGEVGEAADLEGECGGATKEEVVRWRRRERGGG